MITLEGLNSFMGADEGTAVNDSEHSADEEEQRGCGLGLHSLHHHRRISLSSLWPQASFSSSGVVDDPLLSFRDDSSLRPSDTDLPIRLDGLLSPVAKDVVQDGAQANQAVCSPASRTQTPRSHLSLDLFFPAAREQILTWHPNRVFFAVAHLLCERLSQTRTARRRVRGKRKDALLILKSWMDASDVALTVKFSARQRLWT